MPTSPLPKAAALLHALAKHGLFAFRAACLAPTEPGAGALPKGRPAMPERLLCAQKDRLKALPCPRQMAPR